MVGFRKYSVKFIRYFFILFFLLILIAAIRNMLTESPAAALLCLPALAMLLFLLFRGRSMCSRRLARIHIAVHLFSFFLTLFIAYSCRVELSWDWGHVVRNAISLALNGELENYSYFLQYPNNQFWLALLTLCFRAVKLVCAGVSERMLRAAAMGISIILVRAGGAFLYKSMEDLFGVQRARIADIIFSLYLPVHLYAFFAYTDTSGYFCVCCMIYLYCRLRRLEKPAPGLSILFAVMAALVFKIKILAFLIFSAMLIADLLAAQLPLSALLKRYGCICALMAVGILIFNLGGKAVIQLDESNADRFRFPAVHWLMMGMNDYGGYRQKDVDFSYEYQTYEERKAADSQELIRRLHARGFGGTLRFMADTKLRRTWGNSLLAGDDYISRWPINASSLGEKVFSKDGQFHRLCLSYSWVYHIMLLLGCFLSGLLGKQDNKLLFAWISLLGVTLFLSFWECNSRYLFTFIPVLILCSADGWLAVRELRPLRFRFSQED